MKPLIYSDNIKNKCFSIAHIVNQKHYDTSDQVVFACVLNGGFMFFAELVKNLNFNIECDFVRVKSYIGKKEQGDVEITKDLETPIKDKHLYLIDDLIDSGNTMRYLIDYMKIKEPKSITLITLCKRKEIEFPNHIYGFELNDEWIVGMGCNDENGYNRNLTSIYCI